MGNWCKAIGGALIVFTVLAYIAIVTCFQTSATVGFMAVSRIEIINVRFIVGNDTFPDQLRVAIQNLERQSLTVSNGILNGMFATITSPEPAVIESGYSAFVTLAFKPHTFVDGSHYDLELHTNIIPISTSYLTFDAEYSAQHDYDVPLPEPFHESLRKAQLVVAGSIIATLGVTFGLFAYSMFDRVRKRALSIRELAILIGINGNVSLLIPLIGKKIYDYDYTWVPSSGLPLIIGIVSLVFLGYGIFHLIGIDIEGENRRAEVFAILLLTALLFAIFVFYHLMTKFVSY
jgi:hypothetical protein